MINQEYKKSIHNLEQSILQYIQLLNKDDYDILVYAVQNDSSKQIDYYAKLKQLSKDDIDIISTDNALYYCLLAHEIGKKHIRKSNIKDITSYIYNSIYYPIKCVCDEIIPTQRRVRKGNQHHSGNVCHTIICRDTGKEFPSIIQAAPVLGLTRNSIRRHLVNKIPIDGYLWEYKDYTPGKDNNDQ